MSSDRLTRNKCCFSVNRLKEDLPCEESHRSPVGKTCKPAVLSSRFPLTLSSFSYTGSNNASKWIIYGRRSGGREGRFFYIGRSTALFSRDALPPRVPLFYASDREFFLFLSLSFPRKYVFIYATVTF